MASSAHHCRLDAYAGVGTGMANYDVVGMAFDNTKMVDGKAINVDPGGALLYRA